MTHRPNAMTHTQEYRLLPGVVRHTFIIFGHFTTPNLCPPMTQNPGDATDDDVKKHPMQEGELHVATAVMGCFEL